MKPIPLLEQGRRLHLADAGEAQSHYCNESRGTLRKVEFDAYSSEYPDWSKLKYPLNHSSYLTRYRRQQTRVCFPEILPFSSGR
jgi:hypothetical protein